MIHYRYLLILLLVGSLALAPSPALADGVVGTGSADSCTETAFDTVFYDLQSLGGGTLTFNCGSAPHTIIFTTPKPVSADTTLLGSRLVTLSGGNATSLFQVYANKSLTLGEITLTRGYSTVGAIENFGRLTVRDSQMLNNSATTSGGAIVSYGELSLTNVIIAGNSAAQFGGGVWLDGGRAIILDSQFSANTGAEGGGGIAVSEGTSLIIEGSQFASNKTTGIFAEGGGIRSTGTLTVTNTLLEGNNASRGGALFVSNGSATFSQSEIRANWAAYGGGVRQTGGVLVLTDVTLEGNGYASSGTKVTTGGGAISWDGGSASLMNVTMSANWASYGGGFDHANGDTTLTNVTISGNNAVGAGAVDQNGGSITLTNVTIAANLAPFFAGGITNRGGALSLKNTLLSGNVNPDNNRSSNCYRPISGVSFSLSSDFTCGFGADRDNVALPLSPLGRHGGLTWTHLLQPGSPAIDGGTGSGCPPTDQRGIRRPQSQACDVGAVEMRPTELVNQLYLPLISRRTDP